MLHLRWITDIHNSAATDRSGADRSASRSRIHDHLDQFITATRAERPELVINTGDDIETTLSDEGDAALHDEFKGLWSPLQDVSIRLAGNHDVARFSTGDLSARFGFASAVVMHRLRDATIIAWNADPSPMHGGGKTYYMATESDLFDLELALDRAAPHKPVLLFSHIPLYALGNEEWLTESERSNPGKSYYFNKPDILKIIEDRQLNVLCFAGHRHVTTNLYHSDKVHMITQDRFVRLDSKANRPAGVNTCDIIIDGGMTNIYMNGPRPAVLQL